MIVKIWVCPTDGCGNYFAASGRGGENLDAIVTGDKGMNGEFYPERGHSRAQCPDCRELRGLEVERVPLAIDVSARLEQITTHTVAA